MVKNKRNKQKYNTGNQAKQIEFNVSTYNARGLNKQSKCQQLDEDLKRYGVDVVCLQETKIVEGVDINLKNSRLITFPTKNRYSGIGFLINKKWTDSIYKVWQVNERICVLQMKTSDNKILSIINVYGPTLPITKINPEIREELLSMLRKNIETN